MNDLFEVSHSLATDMVSLIPVSSNTLTANFKALAGEKKNLDAEMSVQFSKLAKLRRGIEADIAPYVRPELSQMPVSITNNRL